jgi:hypothetical protein
MQLLKQQMLKQQMLKQQKRINRKNVNPLMNPIYKHGSKDT